MRLFARLARDRPPIATTSGWICFQAGLFFLAATPLVAGIFFLVAALQGTLYRRDSFLKDKWNYPLLVVGTWMVIGCFKAYSGWLAWVGLANWLPLFWCFWGFQPYLCTPKARKRCAFWIVTGTFPVVVTGLGQLWFNWQGPWQSINGLIIWFIAPGGSPDGRLSGLFDYANIAGAWLALAWPFCLAFAIETPSTIRNRFISLIFAVAVAVALFLTDSRNAWAGMFLAIPFVLGSVSWFWLIPLLSLVVLLLLFASFPLGSFEVQSLARRIVPEEIWSRLNDLQYVYSRPLEATRINQWKEAIKLFIAKPWFGYGAAAFSVLYPLRQGLWHGHAHNLPLELIVAHGLPVAVLIVGLVLALLVSSLKTCIFTESNNHNAFLEKYLFDRAWWSATFTLVFLHGADMPFFDSRINLLGWVLLAGLRCIIYSKEASTGLSSKHYVDDQLGVHV